MKTEPQTPETLSEEALTSLESQLYALQEPHEPWESKTEKVDTFKNVAARHIFALCQSLRAARAERDELRKEASELRDEVRMLDHT